MLCRGLEAFSAGRDSPRGSQSGEKGISMLELIGAEENGNSKGQSK